MQEYRDAAGVDEGMDGISTRFAFKVLSRDLQPRHRGSRGRSGAPDVRAGAGDQARAVPARTSRQRYLEFIKAELAPRYAEFIGARNPEGLSGIATRIRPEPVRPLHRLCRRLDRGAGLQGSRHRPDARPRPAGPGAVQDRKAGRHRQSEGLPQRGRQVLAARAGARTTAATRPGPATRRSAK